MRGPAIEGNAVFSVKGVLRHRPAYDSPVDWKQGSPEKFYVSMEDAEIKRVP